jgi:carbonic anhydrase/acetyltransferase-like protein (isoleucine patch superfamily)
MISSYRGKQPRIAASAFVEDTARVIGDVEIGEDSSVWFYTVIRGDVNSIRIGEKTNIQDHCVLHVENNLYSLSIGDQVTVGHSVVLHGCRIESCCLIGIGAMVLNDVTVGENCLIAAGALLPEHMVVPPNSVVMGVPGKVVRNIQVAEAERIRRSAANYIQYMEQYRKEGYGTSG